MEVKDPSPRHQVVAIDPEFRSLEIIRRLLSSYQQIDVVAAFQNPQEALGFVAQYPPDLIFIDVALPDMTGFELMEQVRSLTPYTLVVITSFISDHAVEALRNRAFDYLMKPLDARDVGKVIRQLRYMRTSKSFMQGGWQNKGNRQITFHTKDGILFMHPSDIIYCQADGNYSHIYMTEANHFLLSKNLGTIEYFLKPHGFVRISRSALVNAHYLWRIHKRQGFCELKNGEDHFRLKISRERIQHFLREA